MSQSRQKRRRAAKARLIHSIYVDRYNSEFFDTVWFFFNAPAPQRNLRVSTDAKWNPQTEKLSFFTKTEADAGEAYISKNFPGITYRLSPRAQERSE